LCPERFVYGIHRSTKVPPHVNGCYTQYLPLDARTDILTMNDVPPADLRYYVSAGCSGSTAANAFEDYPPRAGETVVVQGAGPLGVFIMAFARQFGAARVVAIDLSPERLALAREFGATDTLNIQDTTPESRAAFVKDLTGGRGADAVYEAVGRAEVFAEGLGLVRAGGRAVTAGFGQPGGTFTFDPFKHLTRPNLKMFGIWVSHTKHTLQAVDLVRRNFAVFKKLTTHAFPLSRVNEAHDKMRKREALKAVLIAE
jgi:threonine dehydrogenase-like Zn-dependent dehydrogenase